MIKTLAQVIAHQDGYIIARCQQKSSCGSCASKGNCGVGVLAEAMPDKALTLKIPSEKTIEIGALIEIGIAEEILVKSAALIYLFPLLLAMLTALAVNLFVQNEALVILSCVIAGAVGFAFARLKANQLEKNVAAKPVLLRVVSPSKNNPHYQP